MSYLLAQASARCIPLRDESVQCVVTSPPYWGLRAYAGEQAFAWGGEPSHEHEWGEYDVRQQTGGVGASTLGAASGGHGISEAGILRSQQRQQTAPPQAATCPCGAWYGALGLEPTPELYVEHMVEVFREVRRVLRKDGTLWLNLGDSYSSGGRDYRDPGQSTMNGGGRVAGLLEKGTRAPTPPGLKPKDLVGIPWRVAFALQADGWYLRSDIVWAKPNPMPESVTDRPTKSHEYVFLLAKSARYFYDSDAIREPHTRDWSKEATGGMPNPDRNDGGDRQGNDLNPAGRNARSVWNIATQPYPGAHFATFPEALPERCILAGSAAQACSVCGAPWVRVTERTAEVDTSAKGSTFDGGKTGARDGGDRTQSGHRYLKASLGFAPTCAHVRVGDAPTRPSVVLDLFNGSGTTGRVALRLGRRYVGLDLSREYLGEQALARIDPLAAAAMKAKDGGQQVMRL